MCFTDWDSLVYFIKHPPRTNQQDILLTGEADLFDTSNYPKGIPYYTATRPKVVYKFKDECCGQEMDEFVGLRAKIHWFTTYGKETK